MSELEHAVERLYEVFGTHRASRVVGCPCCVSDDERQRLLGKRLRELSGEDLGGFAFSALNTWGTLTDLKHFLPRILELAARREIWTDLQVIYGKFVQEGPWPSAEREALASYTRALFADAVRGERRARVEAIIESAGLSGMDVPALLDAGFARGATPIDQARASALADLVMWRQGAMSTGKPGWIWWKTANASALDAWLLAGRAHALLIEAFETEPEHPHAGAWAAACDVLEALGAKGTA